MMALTPISVRAHLAFLMEEQGMPLDRLTLAHGWALDAARIPWRLGQSVNALLDSLSPKQAEALVSLLREDDMEEA